LKIFEVAKSFFAEKKIKSFAKAKVEKAKTKVKRKIFQFFFSTFFLEESFFAKKFFEKF